MQQEHRRTLENLKKTVANEVKMYQTENSSLKDQLGKCHAEHKKELEDLRVKLAAADTLKSEYVEMEAKNMKLQSEVSGLKANSSALEDSLTKLLGALRSDKKLAPSDLTHNGVYKVWEDIEGLKERNEHLMREIGISHAWLMQRTAEGGGVEGGKAEQELKLQLELGKEGLRQKDKELTALADQVADLKGQLELMKTQESGMLADLNKLQGALQLSAEDRKGRGAEGLDVKGQLNVVAEKVMGVLEQFEGLKVEAQGSGGQGAEGLRDSGLRDEIRKLKAQLAEGSGCFICHKHSNANIQTTVTVNNPTPQGAISLTPETSQELESLRQLCGTQSGQIEALKEKLRDLGSEAEAKAEGLRGQLSSMQAEKLVWSKVQEEFVNAKQGVEKLEKLRGEQEEKIAQLTKDLETFKLEKQSWLRLEETLVSSKAREASDSKEIQDLKLQLQAKTSEFAKLQEEKTHLLQTIHIHTRSCQSDKEGAEVERAKLEAKYKEVTEELEKLKTKPSYGPEEQVKALEKQVSLVEGQLQLLDLHNKTKEAANTVVEEVKGLRKDLDSKPNPPTLTLDPYPSPSCPHCLHASGCPHRMHDLEAQQALQQRLLGLKEAMGKLQTPQPEYSAPYPVGYTPSRSEYTPSLKWDTWAPYYLRTPKELLQANEGALQQPAPPPVGNPGPRTPPTKQDFESRYPGSSDYASRHPGSSDLNSTPGLPITNSGHYKHSSLGADRNGVASLSFEGKGTVRPSQAPLGATPGLPPTHVPTPQG